RQRKALVRAVPGEGEHQRLHRRGENGWRVAERSLFRRLQRGAGGAVTCEVRDSRLDGGTARPQKISRKRQHSETSRSLPAGRGRSWREICGQELRAFKSPTMNQ